MKKRIISLLLVIVLAFGCFPCITANAATVTQEQAVTTLLKSARFTQNDANTVGSWVDLGYYVDLILDTDNFVPDAPCPNAYYNTLRTRSNVLARQNRTSKIPVYPFVKVEDQPTDTAGKPGDEISLSAAASLSNGTETLYQWYCCTDENKTDATPIEGATSETLSIAHTQGGVFYYFCRISAKTAANVEALDTDVVCVTVESSGICVITQPEDLNPDRGSEASLTAEASAPNGVEVSYQWYSCADEDKTDAAPIEGATNATYTVPTDMYGDYYYFCRFSAENAEDVDSDVVCVDVPVMMYKDGLAQPILTYTDASVQTYTNEGSDIVRFCVYVETDYDTDSDGKLDLIKAVIQLPRAAMEDEYDAAVIYEARPYCAGTQASVKDKLSSGGYDINKLYSSPAPRIPAGTATTEELADAAQASDFYFYENLDWYDYFLVRGYAVVLAAGPGTRGSEGFETCGSDLEIDAFACVIEWLTGDRVAYTDLTSNIAVEADWCNGQVGMTGRSYAGTTQFGLATTGVEGLETIVPVGGIASWYEYSCSQGMNLRSDAYTNNLAYYCASRALDASDWPNISANYLKYLGKLDSDEEALNGSYGTHWQIRDYTLNAKNIKCSALIVHGLNDNNVRTKNFQMMYDAYQTAGADAKLLLIQDGHVTPAYGAKKTEQFIGDEAYQDVLNRWFTYHLYDIDNGADDMAAVTVQDNVDGSWDTYDSWETDNSMTMSFAPSATIKNYSSGITSGNYVSTYTASNTDYSAVEIMDITEDVTITGTVKVTVTATPQTTGNNQMLTAFLVDMSSTSFNAYRNATGYTDSYHKATGQIFDVGGGAESYTVVKLLPASVKSKVIASGWIDLANPEAGFASNTAVYNGNTTLEEHTYNIYLQPNLYTVKAGHKLALVICTRDPSLGSYKSYTAAYSVLISNAEAFIPIY